MKFINSEIVRYGVVGIANTLLTYLIFVVSLWFIPYQWAYTIAYVLGIVTAYMMQSLLVFHQPLNWRKAVKYPTVYVVQYVLGLFILSLLVDGLHIMPEIASLLNLLLTLPISFLLSRKIIKPADNSGM